MRAWRVRIPDLEAIDWISLRDELSARGLLAAGTVVGVPGWQDAGKIGYALGPDVTVLCLTRDPRQFGLIAPIQRFLGQDVLLLVPEHAKGATQVVAAGVRGIDALPPAPIRHAGQVLAEVMVLRGHRLRNWPRRSRVPASGGLRIGRASRPSVRQRAGVRFDDGQVAQFNAARRRGVA